MVPNTDVFSRHARRPPMAIASTPHLPSAFPSSNSLTASTTVISQPQPTHQSLPPALGPARHQPPPTLSTPILAVSALAQQARAATGKLAPKPPRTPSLSTPASAPTSTSTRHVRKSPAVDFSRSSTINNNNPYMSSEVTQGPALPRFPPSHIPAHHARQVAGGGSEGSGGMADRGRQGKGPIRMGPAGGARA
ncbi:hypothetical protein BCR44DRAFT_308999 [Catenaria anguillulae PL171]|uniref:Uncharacterized protein n=1 Tax=Catenaria anguillulae PL171 TaxID=765915 RepID=A0A1Y2HUH3_9FUNG|nr:hypothetical protein BCR44DRAFT_308999 [Catenaria anguillulae PL171]